MHPSFLSPLSLCIYNFLQLDKRRDFSPHVSDLRELSAAHPFRSLVCRTCAAALATQARRVPDPGRHSCEVTCPAEACVTASDRLTTRLCRALCRPPIPFPSSPHSRAAYETQPRCAGDRTRPV